MNQFQFNMLQLIKCAISEEKQPVDPIEDWNILFEYGVKQKVLPLIYYGIHIAGIQIPQPYDKQFLAAATKFLMQNQLQIQEKTKILEAFNEQNIRYIVLKGAELKDYYPKPELRPMGDIDIQVDVSRYDTVRSIMLGLGFEEGRESDHELIWNKKNCVVELHKRLIPSYNDDYYRYFGDGWDWAHPAREGSNVYCFSPEDNFVYLFAHFSKHYRDAGIGLLHLIDLYVFQKTYILNEKYVKNSLEQLGLWKFYGNIQKTLDVCFKNTEPQPITDHILDVIFGAGAYGTKQAQTISVAVKKTKHVKNQKMVPLVLLRKRVFMPYKEMCRRHKVLIKAPVLLPVLWVYRVFSVCFFHRNRLHDEINKLKLSDGQTVQQYYKDLQLVGLDFDFSE